MLLIIIGLVVLVSLCGSAHHSLDFLNFNCFKWFVLFCVGARDLFCFVLIHADPVERICVNVMPLHVRCLCDAVTWATEELRDR